VSPRSGRIALACWGATLVVCAALLARASFVADLSAFLPSAPTARQQVLIEQLQDGVLTHLVLIAIEGGDAEGRARVSRELAQRLRASGHFVGVQNGDEATQERDRAFLFGNRYRLAPSAAAALASDEALHVAVLRTLAELSGSAGVAIRELLPLDPVGASLEILDTLAPGDPPRSIDGAWASRDGSRAVLIGHLRASGADLDAQARALDATRAEFAACITRQPAHRLVLGGTSVMALASRATVEGEAARFGAAGLALVVIVLLAVYRSLRLLALGLVPVLTGALVGIGAVSLAFPQVHSLTLAFGTTLLGEAVDYSIYYFLQRSGGTGSASDPVSFWRTIRLGVLTSIAGFAALLFSGFPGLAQLGVYSISGLVAAALSTRYVLPHLSPAVLRVRELARAGALLDRALEAAGRHRALALAPVLAAAALIAVQGGDIWNRDLAAMNPVPAALQRQEGELRTDLGAQDMRYLVAFTARDEQSGLERAELVAGALRRLEEERAIGGFSSPAQILPSLAAQRARQAALPAPALARTRLAHALRGLGTHPGAFEPFLAELERERRAPPIVRADLDGTSLAMLADSLIVHRRGGVLVLLPLRAPEADPGDGREKGTLDVARVQAALAGTGGEIATIDLLGEAGSLFSTYLREAALLSAAGCGVILVLLFASLGAPSRTLRVVAPLASAVLCVVAIFVLAGIKITILHLVGLLLVVAVGSNYALFFVRERSGESDAGRMRTQISLAIANLATVGSFGLLGLSRVPVLSAIGTTVGLGALLAFVFSAMLTRARGPGRAPDRADAT